VGQGGFVPVGGLLPRGEGVALANTVWFWGNDFCRASFSIKISAPNYCRTRDKKDPGIYCNIPGKNPVTNGSFQKKIDRPGLKKNRSPLSPSLQLCKKTGRTDRSLRSVGVASFIPVSQPAFRVEVQTVPGDRTDRF